jgi:uncharacterized protein
MSVLTKAQHLDKTQGPKRILTLDGGGIRGRLSLEYLQVIETLLRKRTGQADLLLCDYFDLIAGTSTGAILAATLACGMSVADLQQLYNVLGPTVFKQGGLRIPLLAPKFPSEPLRELLNQKLGSDTMLDSDKVRTGLMIMTKRLDTGSPWPLHNHPNGRYAAQDGALNLAEIVRASTAAPTYFEPEEVDIHSRTGTVTRGAFVDGGVTPFNDPALQALMLTALEGYGFGWKQGADELFLVSIGTGTSKELYSTDKLARMPAAQEGLLALQSLMDDCGRVNHTILQWITRCLTPWTIDRAVQDMRNDSQNGPKLATYVRYNVLLDSTWLQKELGRTYTPDVLSQIAQMDNPQNLQQLAELGKAAATVQVKEEHFLKTFDIP